MPPTYQTFGDIPNPTLEASRAVVVLAGDSPGSRGGRAEDGPSAILAASAHMELYDEELERQPSDLGLHTLPGRLTAGSPGSIPEDLLKIHHAGAFPVVIGDDRRLSLTALAAARAAQAGTDAVLLAGSPPDGNFWETAVGGGTGTIRLLGLKSPPRKLPAGAVLLAPAREIMAGRGDPWAGVGPTVHLSIHPDFFEPAVLPVPYNLEPGGLGWWQTSDLLKKLFTTRRVVGLDLCGHRPTRGSVAADFTLAKLLYKAIGYRLCLPVALPRT